jgi:23S rRNA (uracil747-C5)-methyltransferase
MHCDYYLNKKCNSCELLNNSYAESLRLKENELQQLFPQHVDLIKLTVGINGAVAGSRNKAKLAVFNLDNELRFGFFHSDGSCQELEECPLHAKGINQLLPGLREILNKYKFSAYDLKTKTGELKYLLISASENNHATEFLLRFVLRSKSLLARLQKAVPDILALSPFIKVISANIQPVHQAILEGDEEYVLTENNFITHQFDEFKLTLGTRSFFQVTSQIAQALYNSVADAVKDDAPLSLIDLYCGVGAFSFYASRYCSDVTGVEISGDAIACAKHSADLNQRDITFEAMDVEKYLQQSQKSFDAVLVNPPRRGLNGEIIRMIKNIAPRFIYYSSCNAQTLARDFGDLEDLYYIKEMRVFDMFPYTRHFETLMCLQRKL